MCAWIEGGHGAGVEQQLGSLGAGAGGTVFVAGARRVVLASASRDLVIAARAERSPFGALGVVGADVGAAALFFALEVDLAVAIEIAAGRVRARGGLDEPVLVPVKFVLM